MKWPQPWQVGSYFTAPPNQFKHDPGERTRHACGLLDDPSWIEIMTIVLIHSFIDSSFTHVCNTLWSHSFLTPLVPSSPLPPPGPHVPFISLFCCVCCVTRWVYPGPTVWARVGSYPPEGIYHQWQPHGPSDFFFPVASDCNAVPAVFTAALTITIGLTGMFSCEVPGGGSFHSGNLMTSL